MSHWSDGIVRAGACASAVEWCLTQPDRDTAWQRCARGDWMLWWAGVCEVPRTELVGVACRTVRLIWDRMPAAGRRCVEAAEAWCRGEATLDEVRKAADAAVYAAAAVYADAAVSAAAAAVYAPFAVYAASAAHDAAAAAVVYAASAAANRGKVLAQAADLCRQQWPAMPKKEERDEPV